MTDVAPHEVTRLLAAWSHGDKEALNRLAPLVYDELRRLAHHYMSRERAGHTLQTTALVNEAYLKLAAGRHNVEWEGRKHFFGVAARLMRQILIDHARTRRYRKRGGGARPVSLDEARGLTPGEAARLLIGDGGPLTPERAADLIALDEALSQLEKRDAEKARVVELHHFLGLTFDEVADLLGVSSRTVKRHWESAKAWLYKAVMSDE